MNEMENIRLVEKSWEIINSHDLSGRKNLFADGFRFEGTGVPAPINYDLATAYVQTFLNAFPDLHFELTQKIAQGDWVVVNWIATGTHDGDLRLPTGNVIPPTGRKGVNHGSNTYQIEDGKIVYEHTYWDMVGMLAQIGLMPEM